MNLVDCMDLYIHKMISEVSGIKIMLLDSQTVRIEFCKHLLSIHIGGNG